MAFPVVVLLSAFYPGFRAWSSEKESFLSHWPFPLFQVVLLPPATWPEVQDVETWNDNASPSYWPPAPLTLNWPRLKAWWWWVLCLEKEMFRFYDKAAFCKNTGNPKMNSCWPFPSPFYVLSVAKPFEYHAISSPPAPLVPFLHLRLPDDNRVKRQPTSRMISRTDSYFLKKSSLNLEAREDFLRTLVWDKLPD